MNFCVGEDNCSSQKMKVGNESTLLVATLRSLFVPLKHCHQQKVEKRDSLSSNPAHAQLCKLNHVKKSTGSPATHREPGSEASMLELFMVDT